MNTIFDSAIRQELEARIRTLTPDGKAQWGKMNVYQMLKHCTLWDEWIQGKNNQTYKQEFFGLLFGKMALKKFFRDERQFTKNVPAGKLLIVKERGGDVEEQKRILSASLQDYGSYSSPRFIHDFFGKMTREQVGILAYKHYDHHLRQFNA